MNTGMASGVTRSSGSRTAPTKMPEDTTRRWRVDRRAHTARVTGTGHACCSPAGYSTVSSWAGIPRQKCARWTEFRRDAASAHVARVAAHHARTRSRPAWAACVQVKGAEQGWRVGAARDVRRWDGAFPADPAVRARVEGPPP